MHLLVMTTHRLMKTVYTASELQVHEEQSHLRAEIGSACRSSSSVGGGYFSGRMRCRNDTGRTVSDCSHLSDTT